MNIRKKGDSKYLLLIAIIVVTVIVVIIIKKTYIPQSTENEKSPWEKSGNSPKKYDNRAEDFSKNNTTSETDSSENNIGGGGGGGGGGGESDTRTSIPSLDCTTKLILYSIIKLDQIENCNTYEGEYCIDKTVSCSAKINNDDSYPAEFEMELVFVADKKSKETDGFDKSTKMYYLTPNEQAIMTGTTQIVSTGEDGLATQKINCFFNTMNNMTQEVCN